jgi:hypothetical protein
VSGELGKEYMKIHLASFLTMLEVGLWNFTDCCLQIVEVLITCVQFGATIGKLHLIIHYFPLLAGQNQNVRK